MAIIIYIVITIIISLQLLTGLMLTTASLMIIDYVN